MRRAVILAIVTAFIACQPYARAEERNVTASPLSNGPVSLCQLAEETREEGCSPTIAGPFHCSLTRIRHRHWRDYSNSCGSRSAFFAELCAQGVDLISQRHYNTLDCSSRGNETDYYATPTPFSAFTPFWTPASPESLDQQLLTEIVPRASNITLRTISREPCASGGSCDMSKLKGLVARIHKMRSKLPVYLYSFSDHYLVRDRVPVSGTQPTLEVYFLHPLFFHPNGNVRCENVVCDGGIPVIAHGAYWGKIWLTNYRRELISRLVALVRETGANGIQFDMAFHDLTQIIKVWRTTSPAIFELIDKHPAAMELLFTELADALKTRISPAHSYVGFNGLWNDASEVGPRVKLADQVSLLNKASGALVEYFGVVVQKKKQKGPYTISNPGIDFENLIVPIIKVMKEMKQNEEARSLFVAGRAGNGYSNYRDHYLVQRWLYAAYLLGATRKTGFHFHDTFVLDPTWGRTGGLSVFEDQEYPLGKPLGPVDFDRHFNKTGLAVREFEEGVVYARLNSKQNGSVTIRKSGYSIEGERFEKDSTHSLDQGALIVLNRYPVLKPAKRFKFNSTGFASRYPAGTLKSDASGDYLSIVLSATPQVSEIPADILLDHTRELNPKTELTVKIRGTRGSNRTALSFFAEIDDSAKKSGYMKINVVCGVPASPEAQELKGVGAMPLYRKSEIVSSGVTPFETLIVPAVCSGGWHTLRLPMVVSDCGGEAGRTCTVRRWNFVRPSGKMDLQDLLLN